MIIRGINFTQNSLFSSVIVVVVRSSTIFRRHFGAHLGLHSITLTQQKLESGSDDSGCVCRIKLCSIPEIFLYCVETKEYCEQNEILEIFFLPR